MVLSFGSRLTHSQSAPAMSPEKKTWTAGSRPVIWVSRVMLVATTHFGSGPFMVHSW